MDAHGSQRIAEVSGPNAASKTAQDASIFKPQVFDLEGRRSATPEPRLQSLIIKKSATLYTRTSNVIWCKWLLANEESRNLPAKAQCREYLSPCIDRLPWFLLCCKTSFFGCDAYSSEYLRVSCLPSMDRSDIIHWQVKDSIRFSPKNTPLHWIKRIIYMSCKNNRTLDPPGAWSPISHLKHAFRCRRL